MREPHFKRILVTGGAGFLGAHLCRALLEQGHEVLCVDNLHTGAKCNVAALLEHPGFELLRHDVTLPLQVEVDEIYNLACPASPRHYQSDPVKTIKTSVLGAINLLGLARRLKARILQASTSEVYGDPGIHPQPEQYAGSVNPVGLRACYDEGKRCAETLFMEYRRQHALDTKIARIFNTYGPGMHPHDGRVVSNFIMQALANAPITIYGDGTQTRSFCYVDDTVEALIRLMQAPAPFSGPVNVGNPEEVSMLELADTVRSLVGSRSEIVFRDAVSDDPARRRPDIALARRELDWSPRTDLRTGLVRTIAHMQVLQGNAAA
jgi:UDP-glucuronate decarboxylase